MITRRKAMLAGAFAAVLPLSHAVAQGDSAEVEALRTLIEEVVQGGNVDLLPDLIAEDAALPDYDVEGLELFAQISASNHADREAGYESYAFEIQTIAGADSWAMAYVRFVGTTVEDVEEDLPAFYAAHFGADGLIDKIYIGQ